MNRTTGVFCSANVFVTRGMIFSFTEAVKIQQRLFTTKPIFLGVEESMKNPDTPCGLKTDSERARFVRKRIREILNSRGEWESMPAWVEKAVRDVMVMERPPEGSIDLLKLQDLRGQPNAGPEAGAPSVIHLLSALSVPAALEKVGHGTIELISDENGVKTYGRLFTVADVLNGDQVVLAKWLRRLTNWSGRQTTLALWNEKIMPLVTKTFAEQKTPVVRFMRNEHRLQALVSIADLPMKVPVDVHGVALHKPIEREVFPHECKGCPLSTTCRNLPATTGVASLWRRLGLVNIGGVPTARGRIVSFFQQEDGLAIGAALEDVSYPLQELIYDLANLDAGFRFCGEENRYAGRLPVACHQLFGLQSIPGYLENGVPPRYGSGAEQVVASVHKNPLNKTRWITEFLGAGDIDRVIIEWRSLLRQIGKAPSLDWPRWTALQVMAKEILNETESPTLTQLPPLDYAQTKRIEHQLTFRRH